MGLFKLCSEFEPTGDQPGAIAKLVKGLVDNVQHQVLLGVTGSGKTYTIANVIEKINRPTLVLAHNKTLAAQLCSEFQSFFPHNAVEYFISYYDYYQPEAYIPSRDAYIEKESQINEEIERLRHHATRSLLMRQDVIIVASVSCIYGLGLPEEYAKGILILEADKPFVRQTLLNHLERVQYERNDLELQRGRYRVFGETIDIYGSWDDEVTRVLFFGDTIDSIQKIHPITAEVLSTPSRMDIYPATHYVINDKLDVATRAIKSEMESRVQEFLDQGKLLEAKRIEQRTLYDLEMMTEMGYCKGIENYSRILSGRNPGDPPGVLLDFFSKNFLTIVDESHVTMPQIRGMYEGDRSRKNTLVEYGFRLPSAADNRPLKLSEFEEKTGQTIFVSATPGPYELTLVKGEFVEQIIRPTGILDPEIDLHPIANQVGHLIEQIALCVAKKERVLITTVTKKLSEDLSVFLEEKGIKVRYLHSDIQALDRLDILHDLRAGVFDVLVGVNLLREGLDLPEVSLVAIMDADKEGFLRNERSLIQIIGRAARHINGRVILYADKMTESMTKAINETNRRRDIQKRYNDANSISPKSTTRKMGPDRKEPDKKDDFLEKVTTKSLPKMLEKLEKEMRLASKNLEFEQAAILRDRIEDLKTRSIT